MAAENSSDLPEMIIHAKVLKLELFEEIDKYNQWAWLAAVDKIYNLFVKQENSPEVSSDHSRSLQFGEFYSFHSHIHNFNIQHEGLTIFLKPLHFALRDFSFETGSVKFSAWYYLALSASIYSGISEYKSFKEGFHEAAADAEYIFDSIRDYISKHDSTTRVGDSAPQAPKTAGTRVNFYLREQEEFLADLNDQLQEEGIRSRPKF